MRVLVDWKELSNCEEGCGCSGWEGMSQIVTSAGELAELVFGLGTSGAWDVQVQELSN